MDPALLDNGLGIAADLLLADDIVMLSEAILLTWSAGSDEGREKGSNRNTGAQGHRGAAGCGREAREHRSIDKQGSRGNQGQGWVPEAGRFAWKTGE